MVDFIEETRHKALEDTGRAVHDRVKQAGAGGGVATKDLFRTQLLGNISHASFIGILFMVNVHREHVGK